MLILLSSLPTIAQEKAPGASGDKTYTLQLSGTVVDTSGAVIAGATVQVRSANGTLQKTIRVGRERLLQYFWTLGRQLSTRGI